MMALCQLTEWIEQHLNTPLTLALLADKAGCSSRHLSHRFKQGYNISLMAYIQKRRLTLASTLLRTSRRSVTEIALMYHFSHLPSFTRAFRKQFNQSPQAFRQADRWDMALFYPSAAVRSFGSYVDIVHIPDDTTIVPVSNKKKHPFWNGFYYQYRQRENSLTSTGPSKNY
ncbi:AraC family transcriptional regulator [Salmonella enterica]|nr:AraC family transcriptional regulator [Salmonella enterica]